MRTGELQQRAIAAFRGEWPAAICEFDNLCPQRAIDGDAALIDAVLAEGEEQASKLRLWTNPACLVLPSRFAKRIAEQPLCEFARQTNFAVAVRNSGGTVVVHRPGVLNISLVHTIPEQAVSMQRVYRPLIDLVGGAMARLGLTTGFGGVSGSFCDGGYNIVWEGRKLGGTSARIRTKHGRVACLAHAYLAVDGDLAEDIRLVEEAERCLGLDSQYVPGAHVTLAEAMHLSALRSSMAQKAA